MSNGTAITRLRVLADAPAARTYHSPGAFARGARPEHIVSTWLPETEFLRNRRRNAVNVTGKAVMVLLGV